MITILVFLLLMFIIMLITLFVYGTMLLMADALTIKNDILEAFWYLVFGVIGVVGAFKIFFWIMDNWV